MSDDDIFVLSIKNKYTEKYQKFKVSYINDESTAVVNKRMIIQEIPADDRASS